MFFRAEQLTVEQATGMDIQAVRCRYGNLGTIIFRFVLAIGLHTLLFPAVLAAFALFLPGKAEAAEPERIVVASGDSFEPLIFINTDGEPDGVVADQWELWSAKTGVEVELRLMEWSEAIPALLAGQVDAVYGVSYTPQRAEFLDLSSPYSDMQAYIFFHESIGGVRRLSDLAGFPVGVIKGSHHEDYLLKEAPEVKPVTFANYKEMIRAAIKGHLQTFVGEEPIISFLFTKEGRRATFRRTEAPYFASDLRIAVRKGETELLSLIERGQAAITAQERQQILDEWTGESLISLIPWQKLILGVCGVFVVVVLLVTWNALLRRRITKNTRTLRESEEKFRRLIDNLIGSFLYRHDARGVFNYVSSSITQVLGYSQEEFLTHFSTHLTDDPVNKKVREYTELSIQGIQQLPYEVQIYHKNGTIHWLQVAEIPIRDNTGRVVAVEGIAHDITNRKLAEDDLRQAKEFIDNAINAQIDTFFVFNPKTGKAIRWNENFSRVSGYTDEEISAMKAPDSYYDDEDLKKANEALKELAVTGSATVEISLITKNGKPIPFEYQVSLIEVTGGENIAISIGRDITERRQAEDALRKSEAMLSRAQKIAHVGSWNWDLISGEMTWSDEMYRITGIPRQQMTWELSQAAVHPDDRDIVQNMYQAVSSGKGFINGDFRIVRPDGDVRHVYSEGEVILDDTDTPVRTFGVMQDITERKQAEEELLQYACIVSSSSDMMAILDTNFVYLATNKAYLAAFGMTKDQIVGHTVSKVFGEEFFETIIKPHAERCLEGNKVRYESWFQFPVHGSRFMSISYSPYTGPDGDIRGFVVNGRDITERKNAEEELRESEEFARASLNATTDMVYLVEPDGKILAINNIAAQNLGKTPDELIGMNSLDYFSPEVAKYRKQQADRVVRSGKPVRFQDERKGRFFDISIYPTFDAEGKVDRLAVFVADITDRKQAEEQVERIFNMTNYMVCVASLDGYFKRVNASFEQILGYSSKELLSKPFFDFIHPDDVEKTKAVVKEKLLSGIKVFAFENRYRCKDGSYKWLSWTSQPVPAENITYAIAYDITERKQAEDKLLDYQKQLRSLASELSLAEERQRRKIATDLHDHVSQSLALTMLSLQNLRKSAGPDDIGQFNELCDTISQMIDHVRNLTFDLSSPTLYKFGLEKAVKELLEDQLRHTRNISYRFSDDKIEKPLDDDVRVLLYQSIRELVINVIKHARASKVQVNMRNGNNNIEIEVRDNGIGFDAGKTVSTARKTGGFGLFNIQERLDYLGGSFDIQSKPGKGSRFILTAPLKT